MNLLERPNAPALFHGILGLAPVAGGWLPRRLTEAQMAHYAQASEMWAVRSHCATGVRLCIRTDSPWRELEFDSLGGARKYLGLEVEVDGQCVASVRLEQFEGTFRQRFAGLPSTPGQPRQLVPHQAFYFADGTHPNELGFMHYATNLFRLLAETPG